MLTLRKVEDKQGKNTGKNGSKNEYTKKQVLEDFSSQSKNENLLSIELVSVEEPHNWVNT